MKNNSLDALKDIWIVNISGCECFKKNWKYYHDRKHPKFLGFTYEAAKIKMNELIKESFSHENVCSN
jgi:hypothetical protein